VSSTRKFLPGSVIKDGVGLGPREIKVVASTGTPDRVGDIVEPSGCNMRGYLRNPIVLADHNPSSPVGTAAPAIVNNRIEAKITFAPVGISQAADTWCGLCKSGVINGVSIGFRPIDYEPLRGGSGTRFGSWELLEISLVAVPANSEALVVERAFRGTKAAGDDDDVAGRAAAAQEIGGAYLTAQVREAEIARLNAFWNVYK
jgi:HK97 family phage prohead protease